MSPIDEASDNSIPTEEIFLELQELRAASQQAEASAEPTPVTSEDADDGLKARIAKLKAMLIDRGAPDG